MDGDGKGEGVAAQQVVMTTAFEGNFGRFRK